MYPGADEFYRKQPYGSLSQTGFLFNFSSARRVLFTVFGTWSVFPESSRSDV
jgi:hypothetical protein